MLAARSTKNRTANVELLIPLWLTGLVAYFSLTTERQRENLLLITWGLMLLPVVYYAIRLALP